MITSNSIGTNGRLGNQMFQYATILAIAKTNGYDYGIPYQRKSDDQYFHLFLPDAFPCLKAKDSSHHNPDYSFYEQMFEYDERLFQLPDNTDIWGYFQTEKYFKNYRLNLLDEFSFKDDIKNFCIEYLNNRNKNNKEIISIHLRLGDYLNSPDAHPTCSPEYYIKALKELPDDAIVFVFSDDINKCKEVFKDIDSNFVYPCLNNIYYDMCLMTMSNYHIIANSTFSWWGAWLSNSKKVIAPSIWFGPKIQKNWKDIYCDGWVVI